MKIRIGMLDNKYWVEGKTFLFWRQLPLLRHFLDGTSSGYDKYYTAFFSTFEDAEKSASEYRIRFCRKLAVYTRSRF